MILWAGFFLFQKIDLVTADLGRFIQNGQQIFAGHWQAVLQSNFYSYTFPHYPFLNHHWGTGMIFFFFYQMGGFICLHLWIVLLILLTFLLLFKIAKKEGGFVVATLLSLLLIPLMTYRKEIRPEIFSCFLSALFFYLLWAWKSGKISAKWLWWLPFLEIIWVNLHIYFFLGVAIVGAFFLEKTIFYWKNGKESLKSLGLVLGVTCLATMINPFGWKGVVHPFNVYHNYGYQVLEEQSVWFLENLDIHNPSFFLFKVVLILVGVSFLGIGLKKRDQFPLVNLFLISGFAFMACWSIRNISLFAFISLPILAQNIRIIWPRFGFDSLRQKIFCFCGASFLIFFVFILYRGFFSLNNNSLGLGLIKDQDKAMLFFKENDLVGPIFNNYDIGGYLIYYLFPQERVFVDNRPETYPQDFFQNSYIPMQENEVVWLEKSEAYAFNTIIFYWHDATPWGQQFLINRVQDNNWVPVFIDERIIIFLKKNKLNEEIIKKFEISKEVFQIRPN